MNQRAARPQDQDAADGAPRPAVAMLPWGGDAWAVVLQPGSDSADLYRAVAEMPAGLEFHAAYGDVDVILVYRARAELVSRRDLLTLTGSVLEVPSGFPDRSRWMTREEQHAYRAGYAEALATVRVFLSRLAGGGPDGKSKDGVDLPANG